MIFHYNYSTATSACISIYDDFYEKKCHYYVILFIFICRAVRDQKASYKMPSVNSLEGFAIKFSRSHK